MAIPGIKSYYKQNHLRSHVVTEEECETIINAALSLMETVDQKIYDPNVAEMLKKAGCSVDGINVRIPSELVKKALKTVANGFTLYDRFGNAKLNVSGTNSYFGMGPTNPFYWDFETGVRRVSTAEDAARNARVADALPNVDFIMSLTGSGDGPADIADVREMYYMLQNTTKPIVAWGVDKEGLEDTFKMCSAVAGGMDKLQEKPFLAVYVGDPITPFKHPEDALRKLVYCCQSNIPAIYASGVQLGTVTPVTLAGANAICLAEILTGLVISQLVNEGCIYVGAIVNLTVDMKTTHSSYGMPEFCLGNAMAAEIFHYLNFPYWGTANATDSKFVDEQAAIEGSMTSLMSCLSGANLIHDIGFMEGAMSGSLEQIVLSDEIIGYAKRIRKGIEITEETLALDIIRQVGAGGQYMSHPHTFKHFRDIWQPTLFDHTRYSDKVKPTRMSERIRQKTQEILNNHKVEALPADVIKKLDDVLAGANARVKK